MDPLYVQILVLFAFVLVTGILVSLLICSLRDESLFHSMRQYLAAKPRRKRKTTMGPNGQELEVEEVSTESYDGPPLDPVSRSKEKREPLSFELREMERQPESPHASHGHHSPSHGHHV